MATIKYSAGAIVTLMTTELNSLANGSSAIASAGYDNGANDFIYGLFELNVTFGSNATANNTISLYLVPAPDGTNYDDGSASILQPTLWVGNFIVRATTAHKITLGVNPQIPLPPVPFKAIITNNAGVAFPASGSTLKMTPYYFQSV